MYKSGHLPNWKKAKHNPSGILIVWLGKDNKPHTKSISASPLGEKITRMNAQTELMLLQLDYMGREYLANSINSDPMITRGLTRVEAKQALHRELAPPILPILQTALSSKSSGIDPTHQCIPLPASGYPLQTLSPL